MRARLAFAAGAVALVATYAVAASRTATPTFSPTGGTYNTAQSVTLSDTTPGAKIYYTTDGSTPTTASPLYSAPIAVSATKTVKAIAAAAGYSSSSVASATYTLLAANPALSPAAGTYNATQTVSMTDATPGASIYYTTNGTTPTTGSTRYTGPISVSTTTTVKAIAAAAGFTNSGVTSATYTIVQKAATPTFSPPPGGYEYLPKVLCRAPPDERLIRPRIT